MTIPGHSTPSQLAVQKKVDRQLRAPPAVHIVKDNHRTHVTTRDGSDLDMLTADY